MRSFPFLAVALTACFSPTAPAGRPCTDTGECPEPLRCSPQNTCEASIIDAPKVDASLGDARIDSPMLIDALIDSPLIDAPAAQLIAQYPLDGTIADTTGMHNATMTGGSPTFVTGYTNSALQLPASAAAYLVVGDSPAFDLPSGRIKLRFKYDTNTAPSGDLGLFSRDAVGTSTDGHFNIRIGHDRRVVVRIQQLGNGTVEAYRCTQNPTSAGGWHSVEVTFGPSGLVMRLDGGVVSGTTWTNQSADVVSCTGAWTRGIAGNNNPIVIGGLTVTSNEGTGMPVIAVAGGVAFDDVEIWSLP